MADEAIETDGDLIDVVDPLTPKEEAFCVAFGDPESPTYSKGTASAKEAGYASPHNAAWKLRRRPKIVARLREFQVEARACAERVLSDLEHVRQRGLAEGTAAGLSVAAKCSELAGKHLGLFFERSVVSLELDARPEWDAKLAIEASHLARLRIEEAGEAGLGALPPGAPKQLTPGEESKQ